MSSLDKKTKILARLPRGFVDQEENQLNLIDMLYQKILSVYRLYGFEGLQTPFFEYSEALGKFLPDQDRPNSGVFSFQDDDKEWLSLRYDLTAPLARFVAENFENITKPYRSYRMGPVFRNEKPGPGRFRQFLQFDADIIGSKTAYADAEICMLAIDSLKKIGFTTGEFIIRLNNRKILDALLQDIGLFDPKNLNEHFETRLTILRALDKWDKFGREGVLQLLGKGRLDESGDFTKGAELEPSICEKLVSVLELSDNCETNLKNLKEMVKNNELGREGIDELEMIHCLCAQAGYEDFIKIDPSVVRGLEYYTGPIFEADLLGKIKNEKGQEVVFGSIGGGGRYDNLISRFNKENLPATGFSIGVSRLITAMKSLGKIEEKQNLGPVVILAMDRDLSSMINYQKMLSKLRQAGIKSEIYVGDFGMKAQMKYADRRNAPCVIIQGSRERENNVVEIKDLIQGSELSKNIHTNQEWRETRPAQITVPEKEFLTEVQKILENYKKIL